MKGRKLTQVSETHGLQRGELKLRLRIGVLPVAALLNRILSSTWICGVTLAVFAIIALMGSIAQAQTGWGENESQVTVAAKKTPPPPPLQSAGSWIGDIQDSHQGPGSISLTLTEKTSSKTKSTLKGIWSISFPPTSPSGAFTDEGTQTGSVTATSVAMTLLANRGDQLAPCKLIFKSIEATQEKITGTYRFGGCRKRNTGTITIQPTIQPPKSCMGTSAQYTVPATVGWWNSNLAVTPGENLSVSVNPSDTWTISGPRFGNYPWVNADGWSWQALEAQDSGIQQDQFADPGQAPAALLYKIGTNGTPMLLGAGGIKNFGIGQPGTIFFSANDDLRMPPDSLGFTDNVGSMRLQISCNP